MTITLPAIYAEPLYGEIQPREYISTGRENGLLSLARAQNRVGAAGRRVHAALLCCSARPIISGINPSTWTMISAGHIRLPPYWRRVRLVARARDCQIRVTFVGSASGVSTGHGSSVGWDTSASLTIAGPTLDSLGLVRFVIEWLQDGTSPRLEVVGLTEEAIGAASGLPDLLDAIPTGIPWVGLADNAFDSSQLPLDVWMLQNLRQNVAGLRMLRTRGMCHLYPSQRPHHVGSIHWRADGPYCISVQPWTDSISVALTLEITGSAAVDMEIFAMTELERFGTAKQARRTTVSGSLGDVVRLTFSGLKAKSAYGDQVKVWVCYRSSVQDAAAHVQQNYGILSNLYPDAIVGKNDFESPSSSSAEQFGPIPVGWAWRAAQNAWDAWLDSADKGNLDFAASPAGSVDAAAVMGLIPTDGATGAVMGVSPSLRRVQPGGDWGPAQGAFIASYVSAIAWHRAGVCKLLGVFVECVSAGPTGSAGRYSPAPRTLPKAGQIQGAAISTAELVRHSVPQLALRHWGSQNQRATAGGVTFRGQWLIVSGDANTLDAKTIDFPILRDPNLGDDDADGLVVRRLIARVTWAATRVARTLDDSLTARFILSVDGWAGGSQRDITASELGSSVTDADVENAAVRGAGSYIDSNTSAYAHGQQATWGEEVGQGANLRPAWRTDEIIWSGDADEASIGPRTIDYPTLIQLEVGVRSFGMGVVVAGVEIVCAPRT